MWHNVCKICSSHETWNTAIYWLENGTHYPGLIDVIHQAKDLKFPKKHYLSKPAGADRIIIILYSSVSGTFFF